MLCGEKKATPGWGLNAPVEVIEERKKIEPQFEESLFLVTTQSPKDLGRIIHVALFPDSVKATK